MTEKRVAKHLLAAGCLLALVLAWQYLAVCITDLQLHRPGDGMPWTAWQHWRQYGLQLPAFRLNQIIGAFVAAICADHALHAIYREQTALHGQARFATMKEMREAGLMAGRGIILARHQGRYLVFDGQEFVLVAAPTRSGKGVGMVIPNLLNWRDSVVVLDVKLENWLMTSGWRQKVLGQDVFLFNPFATDGMTSRWNPLDAISRDPLQMPVDVLQVAQVLYPSSHGDRNRFFYDSAQNLFMGLAMYLIESGHPCPTLGEVFRQGSGCGQPLDEHLQALLERHPGLSVACRDAISRYLGVAGETRANVKATFDAALLIFAAPTVDWATSASDFRLEDIRRKPMSIYFGVPVDRLDLASRLINLFFTQVINLNTRVLPEDDPALRHQALLCLDEFAAFGRLQVVLRGVAFIAGYNLRLLTIVQSVAQLKNPEMYGQHGAETIVSNHAVRVIFPPTTEGEAKEYSEMLGTYTLREAARSHSANSSHPFSLQTATSVGTNISSQRRALLLPQELKQLPRHTAIVDKQGVAPSRCSKAYFYDDPVFLSRLAQVSPELARILACGRQPAQDDFTRIRVAGGFCAHLQPALFQPVTSGAPLCGPAPANAQEATAAARVPPPHEQSVLVPPGASAQAIDDAVRRLARRIPDYAGATSVEQWLQEVRTAFETEREEAWQRRHHTGKGAS